MGTASTTLANWQRAAADLGFELVAPFMLQTPSEELACFGLVPQFGGKNGLVIVLDHDPCLAQVAQSSGYGYSCLYESTEPYEMQNFVDVLNDWGWCRQGEAPPKWYTGQRWST